MRSELRTAIAVLATSVVLLGSATMALAADGEGSAPDALATTATTSSPTPSPSTTTPSASPTTPEPSDPTSPEPSDPTPTPTGTAPPPVPTGAFTVTDAQVRWGVNDESNNKAFAPGTFNFFSAGKIPNPGKGGVTLPATSWSQKDGNVAIEKYLNGSWTPATYRGLSRSSADAVMTGTTGPFSNHEVVISGGSGTVDPKAGTATIQWTGSFTVLYYSGYSFFYVTDPKLTVAGGIGTLTATLSGYGSSMEDLEKWEAIPAVPNVTIANLGAVDLAEDLGFSVTPAYSKVAVSIPADQTAQVRTGDSWGSFPQSFVDYQLRSGSGAYWYSSGGAADPHKSALPVTISYAAGAPVKVTPKPSKSGSKDDEAEDDAPGTSSDPTKNPFVSAGGAPPSIPSLPATVPAPGQAVLAGTGLTSFTPASTVTGVVPRPDDSQASGVWILGGVLLAAAGLLGASPFAYSAIRRTS